MADEWVGYQEAERILGRSRRQIHNYVQSKKIRSRMRGRHVEYYFADLEELRKELKTSDVERVPDAQLVAPGEMFTRIKELEQRIEEAALQIGVYRATLEERTLQLQNTEEARRLLSGKERDMIRLETELQAAKSNEVRLNRTVIVLVTLLSLALVALIIFAVATSFR